LFVLVQVLEEGEVDSLAIVAVAGIAAEGQQYEEVRRAASGASRKQCKDATQNTAQRLNWKVPTVVQLY
jgi:hypothetical protein